MDTDEELRESKYCDDNHLYHCDCGEYYDKDDCKYVDDEWICPECYEKLAVKCCMCGTVVNKENCKQLQQGFVCDICEG